MNTDERMVVLGGEQPPPAPSAHGRHRWLPSLFVAGLVGVLVFSLVGSPDAPVTSTDPGGLTAPPDPPSAFVADTTTTLPAEISPLAVGWQTVELVGGGWGAGTVAHGPDGWLAVSEGAGIVAHTSDNGVLWQARTIPGFNGYGARAAVGEGVLAVVVSSVEREGAPQAAISVDGGRQWTVESFDDGWTWVDDVTVIDGAVHAFGAAGAGDAPVVWRRDADGWATLEDASRPGFVTALVEAPDGTTRAFGLVDGSAAAWTVGATALERVELDLPAPWNSILEVTLDETGGYVGLVAAGDGLQGQAILASTDLVAWREVVVTKPITSLVRLRGGWRMAVSASSEELWALQGGTPTMLPRFSTGVSTGRQAMAITAELATDGDLLVAVGSGTTGVPLISVRGSVSSPLSVKAPADFAWNVTGTAEGTGPLTAVQGGAMAAAHERTNAWLVSGLEEGRPELEGWLEAESIGGWPGGVWALAGGQLHMVGPGESGTFPMEHVVEAVGEIDGRVAVARSTEFGAMQFEVRSGDEWVSLGDPIDDLLAVRPIGEGFVAESVAGGSRSTVITRDGITWSPIEGALRWGSGVPFVTVPGDAHQVQLLDLWPEPQQLELPTTAASTIVRHGDGFFVWAPGSVWVGDPANGWARIPAGVENGVPGWPTLLAGDVPTLVTTSGGRLLLLQP